MTNGGQTGEEDELIMTKQEQEQPNMGTRGRKHNKQSMRCDSNNANRFSVRGRFRIRVGLGVKKNIVWSV